MDKRILHWSYLNLKQIPMDLFLYEELEEVYLKENFIVDIPNWFLNLTALRFINLSGNNITTLPDDIDLLENLEYLDLSQNQISELPLGVCLLQKLQYLNVRSNNLTEIPTAINELKYLEKLNLSKNHIARLPIQLSECIHLSALDVSENLELWHIPERISFMPSLQMLSADRCSLVYLPVALSKFIDYIRIFNNSAITHIPMVYEKFYQKYYESPDKVTAIPVDCSQMFCVEELETFQRLLLPIGTQKIYRVEMSGSAGNQVSLYDNCLKALDYINRLMPFYRNSALGTFLPETYMQGHIRNGPIARCTRLMCSSPLYTSYYFMVVKKRQSKSRQLFTCYFCTRFCGLQWLTQNQKNYYTLEWRLPDRSQNCSL